jgi:hypothetical protein
LIRWYLQAIYESYPIINASNTFPYAEKIRVLKSNGTINILCRCDNNDLSWLYTPEEQHKAHRIIYTGIFSTSNKDTSGRSSCTEEFSNYITAGDAKEKLKKLPGNLDMCPITTSPILTYKMAIAGKNTG